MERKPKKHYFFYQALMGLVLAAIASLVYFVNEYLKTGK